MVQSLNIAVVDTLRRLEELPPSPGAGRAITLCEEGVNQAQGAMENPNHILRVLLEDLGAVVSPAMLTHLSPVDLEQFCLQTALQDDSGSSLLVRLIGAFVEAYACEKTSDKAIDTLRQLERLARSR